MGEERSYHQCASNRGLASGAAIQVQRGRDDRGLRQQSAQEGNGAGQSAGRPSAVISGWRGHDGRAAISASEKGLAEARSIAAL